MTIPRSVAEVLGGHVTFELESIDRLYLNLYVPTVQSPGCIAHFWIHHRGFRYGSSALMGQMTRPFVASIEKFAAEQGVDLVSFEKGQRKDDITKDYLSRFEGDEGVLYVGKAQEKASVVRTEKRRNEETGSTYPWLVKRTAMVNQYYFYCVDRDFGPFFVKFSSYFPYNGKVCLNAHEYVKRQLKNMGVPFEALDNGLRSCADPALAQKICDDLTPARVDALVRKWLRRLPHPFPAEDVDAGYRYDISILQAEFSLTQVLDRPLTGRIFFEEVIRENLDIGRPDRVQLVFDRRIYRSTSGVFRTRVITEGVTPTLHVDYKHSDIKQYHKEGQALRTETTINDTRDFRIGRRLENLSELRKVGFTANRRLLDVQRVSHDCAIGEEAFDRIHRPVTVAGQRAPALRFADPRVLALLSALLLFRLLPRGFTNAELRETAAAIAGIPPSEYGPGKMTYDLRRLRLHGLIERVEHSHRYLVTELGLRAAMFLTTAFNRLLRPGLSVAAPEGADFPGPLSTAMRKVEDAIRRLWNREEEKALDALTQI